MPVTATTFSRLTPRPCVNNMPDVNKTLFGVEDVETRRDSLMHKYSQLRAELEAVVKELSGSKVKHLLTDDLVWRWAVGYGLTYITIDRTRTCLHMDFNAITTRYIWAKARPGVDEFPVVFQGLFGHPFTVEYYFGSNMLTLKSTGDAYNDIPDYAWTDQVKSSVNRKESSHPHVSAKSASFAPGQCCMGSNRFDNLYRDIKDASSLGRAIHGTYKWLSSVTLGDNYKASHSNIKFSSGFENIVLEHLDVIPHTLWKDIFLTGQKWLKALRTSSRTEADFITMFRKDIRSSGGQSSSPVTPASPAAPYAADMMRLLKSEYFKNAESSQLPALRNLCHAAREYNLLGTLPEYFKTTHGLQVWYMAYCYLLLKMYSGGRSSGDLYAHDIMTYMMTRPPLVVLDRDFSHLEHAPEDMKRFIPEMYTERNCEMSVNDAIALLS